jgi:hypothetical protein
MTNASTCLLSQRLTPLSARTLPGPRTPRLRPGPQDSEVTLFLCRDAPWAKLLGCTWLSLPSPWRSGGPSPLPSPQLPARTPDLLKEVQLPGTQSWWRGGEVSHLGRVKATDGDAGPTLPQPQPGQAGRAPTGSWGASSEALQEEGTSGPSPEEGRPQAEKESPSQGPRAAPHQGCPVTQILLTAFHVDF